MEKLISVQLLELALGFGLGFSLGALYDVFRVLRLCGGRLWAMVCDLGFCLGLGLGLFSLGMGPGEGSLRGYDAAAAALGAGLYFALLSRWLLALLRPVEQSAEKLGKGLIFQVKKILKFLKNIFSRLKKRFTINKLKPDEDTKERPGGSGFEKNTEADYDERQGRNIYPGAYPRAAALVAEPDVYPGLKAGAGPAGAGNGENSGV